MDAATTTLPIPMPVPMHMGALHPFEQGLTLLLAFGPFVALGVVVWLRRREQRREDESTVPGNDSAGEPPTRTARPE